jgi:hypothetical protein
VSEMNASDEPVADLTATSISGSIGAEMPVEPGTETGAAARRPRFPRALRSHAFVALVAAGVLLGGGLRLLPTSTASAAGSSGASTACSATP